MAVAAVEGCCGCCTAQVNNAGILTPGVWDQPTFDQTVKVNVVGPVQLSQALLPLLSPGALIVMVSSGRGWGRWW